MNSRAKTIFFALAVLILVAANCLVWIDPWHPLNRNGWLYMSYCIAASTCYYLLPLALLGHYSRWFYRLTLPPLLLLDLVLVFVHLNFGFQLDGCWIGIVLASDPQETMLFLREYRFSLVAILLAYPLAIYLLLKLLARIPEPQTWKGTWLCRSAAIVFLATQIVLPISYTRNCALYLVVDSFRTYHLHRQLTNLRTHPQLPNLTLVSPASASPLGILVIGESATSSHLNLYGYPRDTTPCLSSLAADLIVCTNATAASFNTAEALTYLLTTATRENPSDLRYTLPQALAQAGYAVHLLSNQRHWGRNDNTTQYVFAGCNTQTYIVSAH